MFSATHIIVVLLTVALLLAVSWLSGRKVNDDRSFTIGGNAGTWMVCGALLGTLVGGQSTIGTAQLAFSYGISAWWFTIGVGLGSALLAAMYAGPLRRSGCSTLLEVVAREYGAKAETVGSLLFAIGIFISIVSQVISSAAILSSLFSVSMLWAAIAGALLITALVLFGGIRSAGASGIVKLLLLYVCSLVAGLVVWHLAGGFGGLRNSLAHIFDLPAVAGMSNIDGAESLHRRYGNMVARGAMTDLGGCVSLVLGVVSTQTYAQCIWSAATTRKARCGALLAAAFIPVVGAACTMVGIYMRGHYVTADELAAMQAAGEALPAGIGVIANSAQAFPAFVLHHLPDWLGGLAMGAVLINVVGCGSGLALGAATILVRDLYGNLRRQHHGTTQQEVSTSGRQSNTPRQPLPTQSSCHADGTSGTGRGRVSALAQLRLTIVAILALAVVAVEAFGGTFINDLGFLSLGLRAVAILFPLSFALWLPGRFAKSNVLWSMPVGVAATLVASATSLPGYEVFYGLAAALAVILAGYKRVR